MPNVRQHQRGVLGEMICGEFVDENGSKYSVTLDEGRSCSVRTEKPDGRVRISPGLITMPWKIMWGSSYVLRTQLNGLVGPRPAQLLWQPIEPRGRRKDFLWTREPTDEWRCPMERLGNWDADGH